MLDIILPLKLKKKKCYQFASLDGKELEIRIASLEFESGYIPLVKTWNSRGFIYSSKPIKYAF
jgi:hypothetical protein